MKRFQRKSQEEIVGFVLIMLIIAVIAVIFLGIHLRKTEKSIKSSELTSFLESIMQYTTNCSINFEPDYDKISDLIKDCANKEICLNQMNSCDILDTEISQILNNSWRISNNSPIASYSFDIFYEDSLRKIKSWNAGNCTGIKKGAEYEIYNSGRNIVSRIEVCFKSK